MGDRLSRSLKDKITGLPIFGANVVARPKDISGTSGDKLMAETPANSGFYRTADEIDHGTYGIIVGGVDSQDEATVEPGRVKVRKSDGSFLFPLIDKILDAKAFLSGFLGDAVSSPSSADLTMAIAAATGNRKRELVMDVDCTLSSAVTTSEDLYIDLNGRTLSLNASLTSATSRIVVRNGKIVVASGCKIEGAVTEFSHVGFSGAGVATFTTQTMTFISCMGLTHLIGAGAAGGIPSVFGGEGNAFADVSQVKLTDPGQDTGSGRLTKLQDLIDTWRDWLVTWKSAVEWLTGAKRTQVDSYLAATNSEPTFSAARQPLAITHAGRSLGFNCGIQVVNGASKRVEGCLLFTYSPGTPGTLSATIAAADMIASYQFFTDADWSSLLNLGSFGAQRKEWYFKCEKIASNAIQSVLVNHNSSNGGYPRIGSFLIGGVLTISVHCNCPSLVSGEQVFAKFGYVPDSEAFQDELVISR